MKKRLLAVILIGCMVLNGSAVFADELPQLAEQQTEEISAVEEISAAEEAAEVEETLAAEDTSAVEETLEVEEVPAVDEDPEVEGTTAIEEDPEVEEIPAIEEDPEVEETPAVEEAPEAEEISAEEETVQTDSAAAASGMCGENLTWTFDNNGTLRISGTGRMTEWSSSASRPWNDIKDSVNTIIIEEGVTSIPYLSFYSFHNLTEVSIPSTVTAIGGQAFASCSLLTSVVLPEGLETLSGYAFQNCSKLSSINIPHNIKVIGYMTFDGCSSLQSIILPEGLEEIWAYAFSDSGLTFVVIPDSVTNIAYNAFDSCYSLQSVVLPEGLEEISNSLFRFCTRLYQIRIPKSVTAIREGAFLGCTGLKELEIPSEVEEIEDYAFGFDYVDNSASAPTRIPGFTAYVGQDSAAQTFCINNGLTYITVSGYCGKENASDMQWYFDHSSGTLTISGSGKMADYGSVYNDSTGNYDDIPAPWDSLMKQIVRVVVQEGVTEIGSFAFNNASNLTEVILPESLENIRDRAFAYCTSLAEITFPDQTEIGASFIGCTALRSVTLPKGITFLTNEMFRDCTSLASVVFPEGCAPWYIGWCTFFGCTSLKSITIPASVTTISTAFGIQWNYDDPNEARPVIDPEFRIYGVRYTSAWTFAKKNNIPFIEIGESYSYSYDPAEKKLTVFGNSPIWDLNWYSEENGHVNEPWAEIANEVKEVVIEEGITAVGTYAFSHMASLEKVSIPSSVKSINASAFEGCGKLAEVQIAEGAEIIEAKAFADCTSLETIRIPDSVTVIETYAFSEDTSLRSVTLPKHLKTIEFFAFNKCTALKEITIPASVTQEGPYGTEAYPFNESGLEKAVIEDGMTEIPERFFGYCYSLKEVQIPDSVTKIGLQAFVECLALETIQLPDSACDIAAEAFELCMNLKSIVIPDGTTVLRNRLLSWCKALESVEIPDSVTTIESLALSGNDNLKSVRIPESVTTIEEHAIGYLFHYDQELKQTVFDGITEGFTIYGYTGTAAETYAAENGIPFVKLKREPVLAFENAAVQKQIDDPSFVNPLNENTDGTITFSSSDPAVAEVDPGTGEVTVKGEGNAVIKAVSSEGEEYLAAEATYSLKVSRIPIKGAALTLSYTKCTFNGSARKPAVTVVLNGKTLAATTDYTVAYSNNTNAGTATVTVTGKGKYSGTAKKTFTIQAKAVTPAVTLSKTSYVYDGKVRKPTVTVKAGTTKLSAASYTVTYASGRKVPGKYSVKVTLKGNYSGNKTVYFKIVPKATTLSTLKKGTAAGKLTKSAFTVTWAKQKTQTSGYQIQYSTASTFPSGSKTKTVLIKKNTTTSATVKNLKAGTKYYVRIRTYKLVDGVRYYSAWSAKKAVTLAK